MELKLMNDVETNPGTKRTTVRTRDTGNLLMGDSIVAPVENRMWSVRAVHGGIPTDLRDLVRREPEMLQGVAKVAILVGGNAVCSKGQSAPRSTPNPTAAQIFRLVQDIKERGVPEVYVLGIPKRRCQEDPSQEGKEQRTDLDGDPLNDACKPGDNGSINLVNDLLRQNSEAYGYTFVGVGTELASTHAFADDGVHLSPNGISRLAKILRRCL